MPLPAYGVVIGTLVRYEREPPGNFGKYFHGFVYVNAPLGQYKCAVDVATTAGVMLQYRQLHGLDPKLFAPVAAVQWIGIGYLLIEIRYNSFYCRESQAVSLHIQTAEALHPSQDAKLRSNLKKMFKSL